MSSYNIDEQSFFRDDEQAAEGVPLQVTVHGKKLIVRGIENFVIVLGW